MYVEATETTGDQTTVRKLEAESSDPLEPGDRISVRRLVRP